MSNIAVIYKSKYGTTKQYAQWIAQSLGAELFESEGFDPGRLAEFDIVVYGGGLYAGGIDGIKLVTKNRCKELVVFTVGLANPATTDYSAIIKRNLTGDLRGKTKVFHLRGGIDYSKLSMAHRIMMAAVKKGAEKKARSEHDDESVELLKTYGSKTDYVDKSAIEPIVEHVLSRQIGA